jgi:MoxR-like ATPase
MITYNQLDKYQPKIERVINNMERVMIGKRENAELSLVALLSGGHVLLEDVPGVGKTMMVRSLAKSLGVSFKRVQFTPDLLPSDLTGVSIYNQKSLEFEFRKGPLFGNVVLADEINRTSPKTQAALLEAMEEANVTVDGETMKLPKPFFVMATQNPIEYEGTYPLPEAQLDRFLLKMSMGYPSVDQELELLNRIEKAHPIEELDAVLSVEELEEMREGIKAVYMDDLVKNYLLEIVANTRKHHKVDLGVSPRGSIALMKAAKAYAFIHGREFVIPDDVKYLAQYVLPHRLILKSEATFEGFTVEQIMQNIIEKIKIPIVNEMSR